MAMHGCVMNMAITMAMAVAMSWMVLADRLADPAEGSNAVADGLAADGRRGRLLGWMQAPEEARRR